MSSSVPVPSGKITSLPVSSDEWSLGGSLCTMHCALCRAFTLLHFPRSLRGIEPLATGLRRLAKVGGRTKFFTRQLRGIEPLAADYPSQVANKTQGCRCVKSNNCRTRGIEPLVRQPPPKLVGPRKRPQVCVWGSSPLITDYKMVYSNKGK